MTRFLTRISVLAVGVAMTATAAYATPITYGVNRTIGVGSVTGSIVTDGTIGILTGGNIIGWTLLLNDGSTTFTLQGPLTGNNSSLLIDSINVTGSLTGLFFNFSVFGRAQFQNPGIGSGINGFCMEGPATGCSGFGAGEAVLTTGVIRSAARTGTIQIGSTAATVPEPASLVLVGLGLAALAGRRLARKS